MKQILTFILLLPAVLSYGQSLEIGKLWRTTGIYDSLGNFVERAKIQSFLCSTGPNQFQRIETTDKVNMKTYKVKIFVSRDTLDLKPNTKKVYILPTAEVLTFHTKDSLTIAYKNYYTSYVKQALPPSKISLKDFKAKLLEQPWHISFKPEYNYIHKRVYQKDGLVERTSSSDNEPWKTEYKVIDFNTYLILQGITSPPVIISHVEKDKIYFTEFDYREPMGKTRYMYTEAKQEE